MLQSSVNPELQPLSKVMHIKISVSINTCIYMFSGSVDSDNDTSGRCHYARSTHVLKQANGNPPYYMYTMMNLIIKICH